MDLGETTKLAESDQVTIIKLQKIDPIGDKTTGSLESKSHPAGYTYRRLLEAEKSVSSNRPKWSRNLAHGSHSS